MRRIATGLMIVAVGLVGRTAHAGRPPGFAPTRAVIAEVVPDPDLVERNRRLTARARRGDRFMIGGRITRSVGTLLLAGGIAMLVVHHVEHEDGPGLSIGGGILTGIGAAAGITGGGLSFYGGREIAAARRGELPP